jgi:hypothetical protein
MLFKRNDSANFVLIKIDDILKKKRSQKTKEAYHFVLNLKGSNLYYFTV